MAEGRTRRAADAVVSMDRAHGCQRDVVGDRQAQRERPAMRRFDARVHDAPGMNALAAHNVVVARKP